MPTYDWQTLMTAWNDAVLNSTLRSALDPMAVQAGWLGRPPATPAEIAAAEQRLGMPLPLSLREFWEFSNGWGLLNNFIDGIVSTQQAGLAMLPADWEDGANVSQPALPISLHEDAENFLLNPAVINAQGEWQALSLVDIEWYKYDNFWELMQAEYRQFIDTERLMVMQDQRERILTHSQYSPQQKVQTLLAILQERMNQYQQMVSQDPMGGHYAQGVIGGLTFAEQQVIVMVNLPDSVIPYQFQAILGELQMRQQMSQQQGMAGFDSQAALAKLLQGGVTMQDVSNMIARLTTVAQSEGYRLALQLFQQVKF